MGRKFSTFWTISVASTSTSKKIEFDRREYAGTQLRDTKRFRVVGVLVADADDCHLYITNLSRKEFLPEDLATIYRCLWEVKLLFRKLKTQYRLDEFDTTKKHVVEILLYAALLSLLASCLVWSLGTQMMTSCFRRNAGRRPSSRTPSSFSTG